MFIQEHNKLFKNIHTRDLFMISSTLHKVGNSIILFIPASMVNLLNISSGENVNMWVQKGKLIIQPACQKFDSSRHMPSMPYPEAWLSDEERDWLTNFSKDHKVL